METADNVLSLFHICPNEALNINGRILFKHGTTLRESGAFDLSESAAIFAYIPRSVMAKTVEFRLYDESRSKVAFEYSGVLTDISGYFDVFSSDVKISPDNAGLYYLEINIRSYEKNYFSYKKDRKLFFSEEKKEPDIQLSFSHFKYPKPDIYGGIIYQIFVDRFNRSKDQTNGYEAYLKWGSEIPEYQQYPGEPIENSYLYGGTLWGVAEKIDYLSSLGVSLIYLSPIFESPSNHKYDTSDYMTVDKMFGGEEALRTLIEKAAEKGIGIILDGVFNHTGSNSIYFNMNGNYPVIGAYQSKESDYYKWYNFFDHPTDYECWWNIRILPRLNTDVTECAEFFTGENGVIAKYSKMGIKGLRLDVADELSDSFLKSIKRTLSTNIKKSVLYGEVWEDASTKIAYGRRKTYYLGDELDGVMNYPLREGLIEYIRKKDTSKLRFALNNVLLNAPKRIADAEMNILGSHDTERILTALGGISTDGMSNNEIVDLRMSAEELKTAIRRLKAAYTVLATLPGIPCIYYGDEALSEGYSDPFNRRCYTWGSENRELLSHYKKIGKIRRESHVYEEGEFRLLYLTIDILLFVRYNNSSSAYYTLMNNSTDDLYVSFDTPAKSLTDGIYVNSTYLPSEEAKIFKLDRNASLRLSL